VGRKILAEVFQLYTFKEHCWENEESSDNEYCVAGYANAKL